MVARGGSGDGRLGDKTILRKVLDGGLAVGLETDFVENGTFIYWVSHEVQRVGYGFLDTLLADAVVLVRHFLKAFLSAVAVLDYLRNRCADDGFTKDGAANAFVPTHCGDVTTDTEREMQAIACQCIGILS